MAQTRPQFAGNIITAMVDNSQYPTLAGQPMPSSMRDSMEDSMTRLADVIWDMTASWALGLSGDEFPDERVRVNIEDPTTGFLEDKIDGDTLKVNETLHIIYVDSVPLASNDKSGGIRIGNNPYLYMQGDYLMLNIDTESTLPGGTDKIPTSQAVRSYVNLAIQGIAMGAGTGDMLKSLYDTNDNGIVDNSERLNSQLPSYYLNWGNFVGTPTTISGYGITNAYTSTEIDNFFEGEVGGKKTILWTNITDAPTVPSFNNSGNDRLLTYDGSNVNGETNLTFDGDILTINGPIILGTTSETTNGLIRYTGTDFEGRVGDSWSSLTTPSLTLGSAGQIPIINETAIDLYYSNNLTFDISNQQLYVGDTSATTTFWQFSNTYFKLRIDNIVSGTARGFSVGDLTNDYGIVGFYAVDSSTVNRVFIGKSLTDRSAEFYLDGEVNLYYNNTISLSTTSTGVSINGMTSTDEVRLIGTSTVPPSPTNGTIYYNSSNDEFNFYQDGSWETLGSGGGVTPTDGILDWDSGNSRYQPYPSFQSGSFYSGTTNPTGTTRLNYDGIIYLTSLAINKTTSNQGITLWNNSIWDTLQIYNYSSGDGAFMGNSGSGNALSVTNSSSGNALYCSYNGSGNAIEIGNTGTIATTGDMLLLNKTQSGSNNATADFINIVDNPTTTGTISGKVMTATIGSTERVAMDPRVTNGATAVAYMLDTHNALTTSGALLLSIRNQGTEIFSVDINGGTYSGGAIFKNVTSVSANYTVADDDYTVVGDQSGGAFTITLPSASSNSGRIIVIVSSSSTNSIYITGAGTGGISESESYTFQSDGTDWLVIGYSPEQP